ncbi:hypothetical protein C2E23DRAFT_862592 [Lenzites betulinus]|nr:hypothetical protein C2E23DRAFT_862592 [Lenzites betulinus]
MINVALKDYERNDPVYRAYTKQTHLVHVVPKPLLRRLSPLGCTSRSAARHKQISAPGKVNVLRSDLIEAWPARETYSAICGPTRRRMVYPTHFRHPCVQSIVVGDRFLAVVGKYFTCLLVLRSTPGRWKRGEWGYLRTGFVRPVGARVGGLVLREEPPMNDDTLSVGLRWVAMPSRSSAGSTKTSPAERSIAEGGRLISDACDSLFTSENGFPGKLVEGEGRQYSLVCGRGGEIRNRWVFTRRSIRVSARRSEVVAFGPSTTERMLDV